MGEHRLKTQELNYLAIASGQRRVDPRLNDRNFAAGDRVTFVRYDPETKAEGAEVSAVLTHVANFSPELFKRASDEQLQGEWALLGLSRSTDPVVIPPSGAIALKAWTPYFGAIEAGSRVDLRVRDRPFKLGTAILYQEYAAVEQAPENRFYTGRFAARQVKRTTPWKPAEHYKLEQLREHGVAVIGWKRLEQKEPAQQGLEQKLEQPEQTPEQKSE
ncbi:MAG: DUF3850 domain-containing protein [DPANN group archaeon]|nr:DUF3850 domain-containing protein [DPANN group archaeon]